MAVIALVFFSLVWARWRGLVMINMVVFSSAVRSRWREFVMINMGLACSDHLSWVGIYLGDVTGQCDGGVQLYQGDEIVQHLWG